MITPAVVALAAVLALLLTASGLVRRLRSPEYGPLIGFLMRLNQWYCRLWSRWSCNDPSPLPLTGPAILIANHISPLDPLVLQCATPRRISFLIAREYYEVLGLRWLYRRLGCVPVNRTGGDVAATKAALRVLARGGVLGIFPEGRINLEGPELLEGRLGVALLALRARVPVIPAVISGAPPGHTMIRPFFTPCRIRVAFGPAIDLTRYHSRASDRQMLEEVTGLLMQQLGRLSSLNGQPSQRKGREAALVASQDGRWRGFRTRVPRPTAQESVEPSCEAEHLRES